MTYHELFLQIKVPLLIYFYFVFFSIGNSLLYTIWTLLFDFLTFSIFSIFSNSLQTSLNSFPNDFLLFQVNIYLTVDSSDESSLQWKADMLEEILTVYRKEIAKLESYLQIDGRVYDICLIFFYVCHTPILYFDHISKTNIIYMMR